MIEQIVADIKIRAAKMPRCVVAIVGPPGAGKSTLSAQLCEQLGDRCVVVPMDGFHLDNVILEKKGLLARKGAPQTFDVVGFLSLLQRLQKGEVQTYFPIFDRKADLSRAAAGVVTSEHSIVLVEGNYLLLAQDGWEDVAKLFDYTVLLRVEMSRLRDRLLNRWAALGYAEEQVVKKVVQNDLPNAQIVLERSQAADAYIDG